MKNGLLLLASLLPLVVGVQLAPRPAEPVIVELYRGEPMTVDLLSVRDSAIVVCLVRDLSDDIISQRLQLIRVIPFTEIAGVHLEGSTKATSYALTGGAIGALVGLGIGAVAKPEPIKDPIGRVIEATFEPMYYLMGAGIGGAAGCAIGCGVGASTHEAGMELVNSAHRQFDILRGFVRYPEGEPRWLQEKVR